MHQSNAHALGRSMDPRQKPGSRRCSRPLGTDRPDRADHGPATQPTPKSPTKEMEGSSSGCRMKSPLSTSTCPVGPRMPSVRSSCAARKSRSTGTISSSRLRHRNCPGQAWRRRSAFATGRKSYFQMFACVCCVAAGVCLFILPAMDSPASRSSPRSRSLYAACSAASWPVAVCPRAAWEGPLAYTERVAEAFPGATNRPFTASVRIVAQARYSCRSARTRPLIDKLQSATDDSLPRPTPLLLHVSETKSAGPRSTGMSRRSGVVAAALK